MAKKIYISPSNHGKNANKCLKSGCYEDKHTRPMAEAAAVHLKACGFEVKVAAANKTMEERCREADKWGADVYLPIHTNASGTAAARYLLFMCAQTVGKYAELFDAMRPHFTKIYSGDVKLQERKDLYEINAPQALTFYCEMGFHTNQEDVDNFIHKPEPIGKALAQGLCDYYGVTYKAPGAAAEKKAETKPAAKAKTCTLELPILSKGDKGEAVRAAQQLIIANGYSCGTYGADSDFGTGTESGVKRFQTKRGLKADGVVGLDTWTALLLK